MSEPWNSLEIMRLFMTTATPLTVLVVGWWINRRLKTLEHLQWTNQRAIEKRIELYDEYVPDANDLLCYFTFVGCWKELQPPEVVAIKRRLDKLAHVYAPLFPGMFLQLHNDLMSACFQSFSGWGTDARLRTPTGRRQEAAGEGWLEGWNRLFTEPEDCLPPDRVRDAYQRLVGLMAQQLGLGLTVADLGPDRLPANVR